MLFPRPSVSEGDAPAGVAGFTLVELMVVVALIGLVAQLVVANLGTLIPSTTLTSQANQLVANLDFLRAEARLQGKVIHVELDLTNHRWQIVLPPEETQVRRVDNEPKTFSLGWTALEDRAQFSGYLTAGGLMVSRGIVQIRIDENGFMPDFAIFLTLENNKEMVWTIRVRGMTGTAEVLTSEDGRIQPWPQVGEGAF